MKILRSTISLLFIAVLFTSCGGGAKTVGPAQLDSTVTNAAIKLKKNPNNEKQVAVLEDSYRRATERDVAAIASLKSQAATDPSKWVQIFDLYDKMQIREIAVRPLLPLYVKGRQAQFDIPDVDIATNEAQAKASGHLYSKASSLMNTGKKEDARKAYELFDQLIEFDYDFEDALDQRDFAKAKGSTNVYVTMKNSTGRGLPENFESDLLSIRNAVFTDPWIQYHTTKNNRLTYDYNVELDVKKLLVGRNDEQQQQYREENRVVTGTRDVKDKDGKTVKQPVYTTVYADVLETVQVKPIRIEAIATYTNNKTGEVAATIPLEREEAWQNPYAQFRGDERALKQETIAKIKNGKKPFPSDAELLSFGGKLLNQVVMQLFEQNNQNL